MKDGETSLSVKQGRGKPTTYSNRELKELVSLIKLAIPVEALVKLNIIYNESFFEDKEDVHVQYYYYMILKRRKYLTKDLNEYVLSKKRLNQYINRILIANDLEQGLSISDIHKKYKVSKSLISLVKRDLYSRTYRKVPSVSKKLEQDIERNIKMTMLYKEKGFEMVKSKYKLLSENDLKIICNVYNDLLNHV